MAEKKADRTRNERQARRRAREKHWLSENGFSSWEVVHTLLVNGFAKIVGDKDKTPTGTVGLTKSWERTANKPGCSSEQSDTSGQCQR